MYGKTSPLPTRDFSLGSEETPWVGGAFQNYILRTLEKEGSRR